MTVEVCRIDMLFGNPISEPTVVKPDTSITLFDQSLVRPCVELYVHPNPTGDKKNDTITIMKSMGGKIFYSTQMIGEEINKSRESQSRIDGYKIRSV